MHFTVFFYCDRHDPAAAAGVAPLAYDEIDGVFKDDEADAVQMEVDETYPQEGMHYTFKPLLFEFFLNNQQHKVDISVNHLIFFIFTYQHCQIRKYFTTLIKTLNFL